MTTLYTIIDSPIGELLLVGDGGALHRLDMRGGRRPVAIDPRWRRDDEAFADPRGTSSRSTSTARGATFESRLALTGGEFELRVWDALLEIPYGETASYGEIARRVGRAGRGARRRARERRATRSR